ncbi:hypothetical protein [Phaeobacter sp. J2-8]|nr:hypothetical protein [Phaeobacter sp. J2-8]
MGRAFAGLGAFEIDLVLHAWLKLDREPIDIANGFENAGDFRIEA